MSSNIVYRYTVEQPKKSNRFKKSFNIWYSRQSLSNWLLLLVTIINVYVFVNPFARERMYITPFNEVELEADLGRINIVQKIHFRNDGNKPCNIVSMVASLDTSYSDTLFNKIYAKNYYRLKEENNKSPLFNLVINPNQSEIYNIVFQYEFDRGNYLNELVEKEMDSIRNVNPGFSFERSVVSDNLYKEIEKYIEKEVDNFLINIDDFWKIRMLNDKGQNVLVPTDGGVKYIRDFSPFAFTRKRLIKDLIVKHAAYSSYIEMNKEKNSFTLRSAVFEADLPIY